MIPFSGVLSFGGYIRRGEKYIWSGEVRYMTITMDKYLIQSKGLTSRTELNRFDEAGEAA